MKEMNDISEIANMKEYIKAIKSSGKSKTKVSKYGAQLEALKNDLKLAKESGLSYKDISKFKLIADSNIPISAIRYYCINNLGFKTRPKRSKFSQPNTI